MDPFYLSDSNKSSQTWFEIEQHLRGRLLDLRAQNDSDLSDLQTQRLRGRIAEVKAFLNFAAERPRIGPKKPAVEELIS